MATSAAWDPWEELERRESVRLVYDRRANLVGGGMYWPIGDRSVVFLSPDLPAREQRAVLAHELIHDERQGGADAPEMPKSWKAVVVRDEQTVDDEVARRLIPQAALIDFVAARCSLGEGGGAQDIADEFDVPVELAERALRMLERDWR